MANPFAIATADTTLDRLLRGLQTKKGAGALESGAVMGGIEEEYFEETKKAQERAEKKSTNPLSQVLDIANFAGGFIPIPGVSEAIAFATTAGKGAIKKKAMKSLMDVDPRFGKLFTKGAFEDYMTEAEGLQVKSGDIFKDAASAALQAFAMGEVTGQIGDKFTEAQAIKKAQKGLGLKGSSKLKIKDLKGIDPKLAKMGLKSDAGFDSFKGKQLWSTPDAPKITPFKPSTGPDISGTSLQKLSKFDPSALQQSTGIPDSVSQLPSDVSKVLQNLSETGDMPFDLQNVGRTDPNIPSFEDYSQLQTGEFGKQMMGREYVPGLQEQFPGVSEKALTAKHPFMEFLKEKPNFDMGGLEDRTMIAQLLSGILGLTSQNR